MPAAIPPSDQELKAALKGLFSVAIQCSAYSHTFKLFYPHAAVDGSKVQIEPEIRLTMNAVIAGTMIYIRQSTEFFQPRSEHHREDSLYSYLFPGYTDQGWIVSKEVYVDFHKRVGHLTLQEVRKGDKEWEAMEYAIAAMRKWADFFRVMAKSYASDPEIAEFCQKGASVLRSGADNVEAEGLASLANAAQFAAPAAAQPPPAPVSDLMSFRMRLQAHFGADVAKTKDKPADTNLVIGALNHEQFGKFRAAFDKRLGRLAALYPTKDPNRTELLKRLNEIGNPSNWPGAYAEVVAIDFLNSNADYLPEKIELSKKGPATDTLAGALAGHVSDHDGYYPEWRVLFDVKVLSDKAKAMLDGIIEDATKALAEVPNIMAEYPIDGDFAALDKMRPDLLAELTGALAGEARPTYLRSSVVPELTFNIAWKGGIQMTTSAYNPYTHAENHHTLLFKHAAKFSRVSPSLIVFVVFPWYSEKGMNIFGGEIFYRAFARRFFCQYRHDNRPANSVPFLPGFVGGEVVSQITGKLSGVIFIEDSSIKSETPDAINARAFAYLNPNAEHFVSRHFRSYLETLDVVIDDFEHDNY